MLRKRLFIKLTENEERLLFSASFTVKFEFPKVLCDIKHIKYFSEKYDNFKIDHFY